MTKKKSFQEALTDQLQRRFDDLLGDISLKVAKSGSPTNTTIRKANLRAFEQLTDQVIAAFGAAPVSHLLFLRTDVGGSLVATRAHFADFVKARLEAFAQAEKE
jgi:hypothetical protein